MNNPKIYPSSIEQKIGFDSVRRAIAELCSSKLARARVNEMEWSDDIDTVTARLEEVNEMMTVKTSDESPGLDSVIDDVDWLTGLRVPGSYIERAGLAQLKRSLTTAANVSTFFSSRRDSESGATPYPRLTDIAAELTPMPTVVAAVDAIVDRSGEIKDNASAELAEIRRELSTIQNKIAAALRRVVSLGVKEGYLEPDTTPSIRDGRPVIPVAPMNKRRINGIIHDESASGKTFFIEPAEVVELNNLQRELQHRERREIIRILTVLTDSIRPHLDELLTNINTIITFDFINAKAAYAILTEASLPTLSPKPAIEWYRACHPVLKLSLAKQNRQIVPLNIELNDESRILVVSGPNAGGKSVTLKTVGIVQYMAQCGVLPTLDANSHMGLMTGLLIDIGDDQSIEDDLSTYSSHLRNMKYFLTRGDSRTMILIDEFGGGTEPQIGGAIAQALLAEFNDKHMWGIITTHYQNLKTMAEDTPGLVNGSMLYDRHLMQPLFKLSIGHPGSSFAVEIARKTGLPESIIARAEEIVGSDYVNLDKYLLDITRDKRYWENKRTKIKQREKHLEQVIASYENDAEQLRRERRQIISDAKRQGEQIIAESNASIERTIHEIKRAQADKEATRSARQKLADDRRRLGEEGSHLDAEKEPERLARAPKAKKPKTAKPVEKTEEVNVGDNVLLDKQGTPGTVMEIQGKKAVVNFGAMKLTVKLDRLSRTMKKPSTGAKAASFVSASTADKMRDRQLNFNPEIDVRGFRGDEAVQAVTYFIDDAIQFNIGRVRILHGTGTGALRQLIRQYLHTIPSIRTFHDEDVRFGGAGITVVEF
jgi:DNA mismatch repair protein MutS2